MEIDDLTKAIENELTEYSEEIATAVKKSVDEVATETLKEIKTHVTFNGTKYVKAMTTTTTEETATSKTKVWRVKAPYYRLTHLLEHGHATRNGGRTRAFPHIKYGEEYAQKELTKRIKEKIDGIS